MIGLLIFVGLCLPWCSAEPAACNEDSNCMEDYYCDLESYSCRPCLRCEEYKRSPPGGAICATTVADCGGCLQMNNCGSNTNFKMESPSDVTLPVYAWVLLALMLVVIAGGAVLIPVVSRLAYVYAWVLLALMLVVIAGGAVLIPVVSRLAYAPVSISEGRFVPASEGQVESALIPPPSYNAVFNVPNHYVEEEPSPYIKPSAPCSARETASREATVPYDPPNYVRGPTLSHGPTPETQSINNDTGMDNNSDAGVISLRNLNREVDIIDAAPGAGSNISVAECPPTQEVADTRRSSPLVVVNNTLHVQSVALSGATLILPQST